MTQSPDDSKLATSVCQLAMAIFDLPGAALRLYDGHRLITCGAAGMAVGFPDDLVFTHERDVAEQGLCVADAARDRRFFLDPLVLATPGVRFYADAPLIADGPLPDERHVIGRLAIYGDAPCLSFDARRQALLAALADIAAILMTAAESARDRETLQAALKAQTARLDRAASLTRFGYWTIDLARRELHWSDGLYALYGLDRDSFTPTLESHVDRFGDAAEEVVGHLQRAVAEGVDFDFTLDMMCGEGEASRRLRTCGGVEYDVAGGLPARLCAVVCDVSEQAATAVVPHDEPLMRFTQELRHPLKDILDTAKTDHADIASYSEGLRASAEALEALMGETLSSPEMAEPPVHVADVIRAAVEPFIARARANHTRLDLHFVDFNRKLARLDVMPLEHLLQNLIGHACKFTRGGMISVTIRQVQAENAASGALETRLHVSVHDSGQDRDPYHGQNDRTRLSVARTIVERLEGHVGIQAQPGQGTHVWFEIPLDWTDAQAPRPRHLAPDPVLAEPRGETPLMRGPAYVPGRTSSPRAGSAPARAQVPDEDRINREYLRALLQDMKLV